MNKTRDLAESCQSGSNQAKVSDIKKTSGRHKKMKENKAELKV